MGQLTWLRSDARSKNVPFSVNNPCQIIRTITTQVLRVMNINQLDNITPDVIEAARETLVVGT